MCATERNGRSLNRLRTSLKQIEWACPRFCEVLEWVRDALHASHADQRREHGEAIKRHQAEYKRLDDRIRAMYVDKLDGIVEVTFYDKMSNQWRDEQSYCQRELERLQTAKQSYMG